MKFYTIHHPNPNDDSIKATHTTLGYLTDTQAQAQRNEIAHTAATLHAWDSEWDFYHAEGRDEARREKKRQKEMEKQLTLI